MNAPKKSVPRKRTGGNPLFRLCVVAFAVYAGVSILQLQMEVFDREQELSDLVMKCSEQRLANKDLELQLSRENDSEYIERMARERLEFVYPYETVFVNAGS